MKQLRFMRLWIVAVCATGVAAATIATEATLAQASELPQFGTCTKVSPEGKRFDGGFVNATCTKESPEKTGKYEGQAGLEDPAFTVTGGESTFVTHKGTQLTCKTMSGLGEFGTPKQIAAVRLVLGGCEHVGVPCTGGEEGKEGEIATSELKGELGWISEATLKAGLELSADAGAPVLEAQCGGVPIKVSGSVVVAIKHSKEGLTITASSSKKGVQKPDRLEGGPVHTLEASTNGGPFEAAGLKSGSIGLKGIKGLNINVQGGPWRVLGGGPYFIQPDASDNRSVSLKHKYPQEGATEFLASAGEVTCFESSGGGKPQSPGNKETIFRVTIELSECTLNSDAPSTTENPYEVDSVKGEFVYYADGALELPVPLVLKMPEMPTPSQQCTLTFPKQMLLPDFLEEEGVRYRMLIKVNPFYLATEVLFRNAKFEWGESCNTSEFNGPVLPNEGGFLTSDNLLEGPGSEGDQLEWHGS